LPIAKKISKPQMENCDAYISYIYVFYALLSFLFNFDEFTILTN